MFGYVGREIPFGAVTEREGLRRRQLQNLEDLFVSLAFKGVWLGGWNLSGHFGAFRFLGNTLLPLRPPG
jgi:hypothetical protein